MIKLCIIYVMHLMADSNCHTEGACVCHAGRQEMFIAAMMLYAAANACIGATPAAYAADVMPQSVSGFGLGIYRCAGDIGAIYRMLKHIIASCKLFDNGLCNLFCAGHMAFCLCSMPHKLTSECGIERCIPSVVSLRRFLLWRRANGRSSSARLDCRYDLGADGPASECNGHDRSGCLLWPIRPRNKAHPRAR